MKKMKNSYLNVGCLDNKTFQLVVSYIFSFFVHLIVRTKLKKL